jgi:hypothetical protein
MKFPKFLLFLIGLSLFSFSAGIFTHWGYCKLKTPSDSTLCNLYSVQGGRIPDHHSSVDTIITFNQTWEVVTVSDGVYDTIRSNWGWREEGVMRDPDYHMK